MKNLLSYCITKWYENDLAERKMTLQQYLEKYNFDGIEQLIYSTESPSENYGQISAGVHLAYWPYWIDFWQGNSDRLKKQFKNKSERVQYFGGAENKIEWLSVIKENIMIALRQNPDYLVWHVSECSTEEIYTFSFGHSDEEVIKAAAEVFNSVSSAIPDNVAVLFENLWWPGLRLLDRNIVRQFFSLIEKRNIGIMLDTGHLLNTDSSLENEREGVNYMINVIAALGSEAEKIKGIHLNCSLSGAYQRSFRRHVPAIPEASMVTRHIMNIDQHRPFKQIYIRELLNMLKPDYIVHELNFEKFSQLDGFLLEQLAACGLL